MAVRDKIEDLGGLIRESIGGEVIEQNVELLLPPGENYGSIMYRVDFKVKKENIVKECHAVAKCTPLNKVTQSIFNTQVTFKSEIAWYTTVIPLLKKFAKEHGLKRKLDFFQTLYGARISLDPSSDHVDKDGVILTENLKYLGYHNVDRHQGFDEPTTLSILKDLAAFHAVPLALRVKSPDLFDKYIVPYCNAFGINEKIKESIDKMIMDLLGYIPEMKPYLEIVRKNLEISFPFYGRQLRDPWISVMHLDAWCNNIMITGGENSKNILLDFQGPLIGTPAGDVAFFLLTSVKLDVIKTKFDDFVKFYHEQFIGYLQELDVDIIKYNYEAFLKEIDTEIKLAEFSHAIGHTHFVLQDRGVTEFDASDSSFDEDKMASQEVKPPNPKEVEKLSWLTKEAVQRKWI